MQIPAPWKKQMLASAFLALVTAGCCTCPPSPLLEPVVAWSPFRKHPCYRAGGHDALFGHRGTCWARWPAEWVPCPEQCNTLMPQPEEFVPPPPIEPEGFQGPAEEELLPPPVGGMAPPAPEGGFAGPYSEIQRASFEQQEAGPREEFAAPRPLINESLFLR